MSYREVHTLTSLCHSLASLAYGAALDSAFWESQRYFLVRLAQHALSLCSTSSWLLFKQDLPAHRATIQFVKENLPSPLCFYSFHWLSVWANSPDPTSTHFWQGAPRRRYLDGPRRLCRFGMQHFHAGAARCEESVSILSLCSSFGFPQEAFKIWLASVWPTSRVRLSLDHLWALQVLT